MQTFPYKNFHPQIHPQALIFPSVILIGDVKVGKDCSIWHGSVIRGDLNSIEIDEGSNIQELTNIHVDKGRGNVKIGKNVTVGHRCIIHGCEIQDEVLVGMGSIVMDEAVIGSQSIVGAGSLITKGKVFPSRSLILGNPAKVVRELSQDEIRSIQDSARHYIELAKSYKRF